jgi:CheY-like chemotaxis protein
MIPGHSGLEVLKVLRSDPTYGCIKTKIVIITNLGEQDAAKEAWGNDADGFVLKANILPNDLIDVVHSLETK